MVLILKLLYGALIKFDDEYRDRRSENYFILSSFSHMLAISFVYYVFVKHLGPKLMEHKKALDLKNVVIIYNALQVIFNVWLSIRSLYGMFWEFADVSVYCTLPNKDYSIKGQIELRLCYYYFLLKIFDYTDTVFMVLRKRNRQITFLHVYHHIMVSLGAYFYLKYMPGGHTIILGIINSCIHSVMYLYYLISAANTGLKNAIWWKKYITQLQLLQFLFLTIYFAGPLVSKNCDYPVFAAFFLFLQSIVMLVLFSDFYRRTYHRGATKILNCYKKPIQKERK